MNRPWSGQEEAPQFNDMPEFDPGNPLCPGVTRPNGLVIEPFAIITRILSIDDFVSLHSEILPIVQHLFSLMIFQHYWKIFPHQRKVMTHCSKLKEPLAHAELCAFIQNRIKLCQ